MVLTGRVDLQILVGFGVEVDSLGLDILLALVGLGTVEAGSGLEFGWS